MGGDLFKEISQSPLRRLSEEKTMDYVWQVIQAVKHLHSKLIIHRDIRPENILNSQGTIKLSEFGQSVHAPNDRRNTVCGTSEYQPLEMLYK